MIKYEETLCEMYSTEEGNEKFVLNFRRKT
jgi:hypothetical protein